MSAWLPESISIGAFLLLMGLSVCTSCLTACLGAGGGILMLMALSFVLPPEAIIAIHGGVQLGSNVGRAVMARGDIDWRFVGRFLPAALLGTVVAALILVQLPAAVWQISIALFVLWLCWGPDLPRAFTSTGGIWGAGWVTGFLTMFVGATGPLISAYVKQLYTQRHVIVATVAAVLSFQHAAKVVAFAVNGFDFFPWLLFIGLLIAFGALGTWIGLRWLGKFNNTVFNQVFNVVLSVLAVRLLWQGLSAL